MRLYQMNDAARMLGVHANTLRNWDQPGFVEPMRTESGLRVYTTDTLIRAARVWALRQAGFSLQSIRKLLDVLDAVDTSALEDRPSQVLYGYGRQTTSQAKPL